MNDLSILFYVKKSKKNKAGAAPIYLRITVNGQRTELSTKRTIIPENWDGNAQRAKGKSEKARLLNNYMDEVENDLNRHYNIALQEEQLITSEFLKEKLNGIDKKKRMLIPVFEEHNKLMELQKGKKYVPKTVARYVHALEHIRNFLHEEYSQIDIELSKLDIKFMRKYEIYLQTRCNYHPNTVTKYLKILKTIIHTAISFGYIDRNPFQDYSTTYKASNRQFLTSDELNKIETKIITDERLERVRDVFIFICYTGISYSDLLELNTDNVSKRIDGKNWLTYQRLKTKIRTSIPLLSPAQGVVDKYKDNPTCMADGTLFPLISNQKFNEYLKEIATLCKINKTVTAHIGRHTFATTITLSNGVPMETVQKMLAHADISTTQIYSKVIDTKVSEDMSKVESKIKSISG